MSSEDKPKDEKNVDCPLCNSTIHSVISLGNAEKGMVNWYLCHCGYMFNLVKVNRDDVFNAEYLKEYKDRKMVKEKLEYYARLYFPLIEEMTYGRRALDIGCGNGEIVTELRRRGWLAAGIDLATEEFIKGDFEIHDFEQERFDLILMTDVLQSMYDVVNVVKKAVNLLRPGGMILIVTPNTDLMRKDIIQRFGHWDMNTNRSFINENILNNLMIKACPDFTSKMDLVINIPANFSQRFVTWNNMHMLYRKQSIEYVDQTHDLRKEVIPHGE